MVSRDQQGRWLSDGPVLALSGNVDVTALDEYDKGMKNGYRGG